MSWFQLDANSVAQRARAAGGAETPCLGTSLQRGITGFTLLSVAGFAPWAVFGRWLHRYCGEGGMYSVCALVFIGLSGPLLHRLIIGPGSLSRFYKLFAVTFAANSILWIAGWMTLRGHVGSVVGLLAGTTAMGWMIARAFDATEAAWKAVVALFVFNSLGYFVGGWAEAAVMGIKPLSLLGYTVPRKTQMTAAMLLWGVFYGIGFGAGLGFAFYTCQERARKLLRGTATSNDTP